MPSLLPKQRYPQIWELLRFASTYAAKIRPAVADPDGALRQGKRPFSLSFFTLAWNVIERLFPPGVSEPRSVHTFTLVAAEVPAPERSGGYRQNAGSTISVPAQYPSGIPVYTKTHLAWTWSVAEANQAIVAGEKTGAHRHESTRLTNAQYTRYCSCCSAGPRPPP